MLFCCRWPGLELVSWIRDSDERPMVGTGCRRERKQCEVKSLLISE